MVGIGRHVRNGFLTLALIAVAACSTMYSKHGYVPSDADLDRLIVGVDTRDTVRDLVGEPSSAGVMSDGGWYYVTSRWQEGGVKAPQEIEREVVALSFDPSGRLENVERFGLERGRVVALERRVTESSIKNVGLLRQLFSNIGRVTADQVVN